MPMLVSKISLKIRSGEMVSASVLSKYLKIILSLMCLLSEIETPNSEVLKIAGDVLVILNSKMSASASSFTLSLHIF